jgi:hypothetical protein
MIQSSLESPAQPLSPVEFAELVALKERRKETAPAAMTFLPSPERIRHEIEKMLGEETSPYLSRWVDRYALVGKRNPYLWKWCRKACEVATLPCVDAALRDSLCDVKTLGVMLDVLWDDVADRGGNGELLEELIAVPVGRGPSDFSRFSPSEQAYAQLACDVWEEIMAQARRYPRHEEFAHVLRFDYLQLCNVMRYSHLLNATPELLNLVEHDSYTPHNMHILICSTFDLMCSPKFDRAELGRLREVVWRTQWMGRIGNLVTTWQRELGEKDFTSGVYARCVARGEITVDQLMTGDRATVEQTILAGGHEEYFLRRWKRYRDYLLSPRVQLRSFDVRELVAGFERLICLHLGSRGSK